MANKQRANCEMKRRQRAVKQDLRKRRCFFFLKIMFLCYLLSQILQRNVFAWEGIPKVKIMTTDPSPMDKLSLAMAEAPSSNTEWESVDPGDGISEIDNPLVSEEHLEVNFDWGDGTSYENGFTDLEDLDSEWEDFDEQMGMTSNDRASDDSDLYEESILLTSSLRSLAWPVALLVSSLAATMIIVLSLCYARKQIYCCGHPCFDSSLDAASNYDRSATRKEKMKIMKINPLVTRQLEEVEMRGIATCLRQQFHDESSAARDAKVRHLEFMAEYDRRFPSACFRPIEPASHTVPKTHRSSEQFLLRMPTATRGQDGRAHVYDEVLNVDVLEV